MPHRCTAWSGPLRPTWSRRAPPGTGPARPCRRGSTTNRSAWRRSCWWAEDGGPDLARGGPRAGGARLDGTQVVIVANAPADAASAVIRDLDLADPGAPGVSTEVVWTSARLGIAAALNAGIRRAAAPVVVLLHAGVELAGDVVAPLIAALEDPSVAVAGPFGLVSRDMQRFEDAPETRLDVEAIAGGVLAFRRSEYLVRGPLDEHFETDEDLALWWSLALRDTVEDEEASPRRAVLVGVPATRVEAAAPSAAQSSEQSAAPGATDTGSSSGSRRAGTCSSEVDPPHPAVGDPTTAAITKPPTARFNGRGLADNIVPPAVWHGEASFPARCVPARGSGACRPASGALPPILRPCVVGSASRHCCSGSPAIPMPGEPGPGSRSRWSGSSASRRRATVCRRGRGGACPDDGRRAAGAAVPLASSRPRGDRDAGRRRHGRDALAAAGRHRRAGGGRGRERGPGHRHDPGRGAVLHRSRPPRRPRQRRRTSASCTRR